MRLPPLAWLWIAVEVAAVAAGTFISQRPTDAFDTARGTLAEIGLSESRLEKLAEDDAEAFVLLGSLLIGVGVLAAVAQQAAAGRRTLATEAGELVWLDRVREGAGPALRLVLESTGAERQRAAADLRHLLLVVASRKWGGLHNKGDARLAYYRLRSGGAAAQTFELESEFPDTAGFPKRFSHPHPPRGVAIFKRRLWRFWQEEARGIPTLRAGVVVVPVGSPLEVEGLPFGLVVVDVPKRRLVRPGSDFAARFLSAWLGAAELGARGATR